MLREGREALGLSFADMAEITRIQPMWLHCLEQERFEEMPAEVFIRGFIKSYARELRLNEEEVFETYLRQTSQYRAAAAGPTEIDDAPQRLAVARLAAPSNGARYAYGAAVAMLVALLAVAVLAMSSGGQPDSAASNFRSNDTTEAWQPALDSSADWRRR